MSKCDFNKVTKFLSSHTNRHVTITTEEISQQPSKAAITLSFCLNIPSIPGCVFACNRSVNNKA